MVDKPTIVLVHGAFQDGNSTWHKVKPEPVRDGRLITGQQQYSGAKTARLLIEALGA